MGVGSKLWGLQGFLVRGVLDEQQGWSLARILVQNLKLCCSFFVLLEP